MDLLTHIKHNLSISWDLAQIWLWKNSPITFSHGCIMCLLHNRNSDYGVETAFNLTHWGQVTHICVGKLTIIGSDNGLSPGRRQAIIWTNAGILLIEHLGINFSEILIKINTFSFKKMYSKMSSGKWRPFCLGLNVLTHCGLHKMAKPPQITFSGALP